MTSEEVKIVAGIYAHDYEIANPGVHPKTASFHGFLAGWQDAQPPTEPIEEPVEKPKGLVSPEDILDMHIYHAGGYRVNGIEDKQGGVDFFKKGWPSVYKACLAAMKEYASREVLAYAKEAGEQHAAITE